MTAFAASSGVPLAQGDAGLHGLEELGADPNSDVTLVDSDRCITICGASVRRS